MNEQSRQGPQTITVLGATGSIGVSTLDVCARHPERYQVFALTAHSQVDRLLEQVITHSPRFAVMTHSEGANRLRAELEARGHRGTEVLSGVEALEQVASDDDVDMVMAAIVGAAGLLPTLAAVKSAKRVLLANKESLVMAGSLFMDAVVESGAELLPIDSEHNAIFQCMPANFQGLGQAGVRKILLTGSGGPFRQRPIEELASVTPDQACAHPNWSMGRKISVDSATMMNKGLELVEACWLFNTDPSKVEVVVHPQSVIHSMVEYVDGSVLAQLGNPDMRTPIAHGMAWPERIDSGVATLDIIATARLDFEAPDYQRFPCLRLATEAVQAGRSAVTVLNAANEIAVEAFLNRGLGFTAIAELVEEVLQRSELVALESLEAVLEVDRQSRELTETLLAPKL